MDVGLDTIVGLFALDTLDGVVVFVTEEVFLGQVMVIAALAMDDFTEQTLLCYVQRHHLAAGVAAVFQHH